MKNIAVLVSGGGTNLQALMDADLGGGRIVLVISSKSGVYALTRAEENNIGTKVVEWKDYKPDRAAFSGEILRLLKENDIELTVYAGFTVILDECVCEAFPNAMLNVHPSLIPAFCGEGFYGLKVHEKALEKGVKLSGATVHFVTGDCDGGPIVLQKSVPVLDGDTPESLRKRVMEKAERVILPQAVKLFCEGRIGVSGGKTVIKRP
ncbi:MAG: phosphoribosylglycinamide formyltransferase [Oscillospiraceae bacterium]|jgi:phosphoribosylglycinamide formyltransferase-1|nr:phosphoribosylglycinamide formyltransferase [Oscillospiraceae bacterium]